METHKLNNSRLLLVHSSSDSTLVPTFQAAVQFFRHYAIPYRVSYIVLNEKHVCRDGHDSFEETVTQLKDFLEKRQIRGLEFLDKVEHWVKSHLNRLPRLLILTDTLGSCLVKGVALKGTSGIPTNTDLLLFLEEWKELDLQQVISAETRQSITVEAQKSINESGKKVTAEFDCMMMQNNSPSLSSFISNRGQAPDLGAITWKDTYQRGFIGESLSKAIIKTLQETIKRVYPDFTFADPYTIELHSTKMKRYKDILEDQQNKRMTEMKGHSHLGVQFNLPDESSVKGKWDDLKDQAESRLESGDHKLAFAAFQTYLRMALPCDTGTWEIKSKMAFAQMMLGQYVNAEDELRRLRSEVARNQHKNPIVPSIHGPILLNHALALSRLGRYSEVEYCLREILLQDKGGSLVQEQTNEQQTGCMLSSTVFRLQALAVAHRECLSPVVDDLLGLAEFWCQKIQDVNISEPVRISNVLNKCRVLTLRGHYTEALSLVQPELVKAITYIGETNILTIEATLLLSLLQIETGQFRLGRLTCERCADVIEDTFGNEHPLALETEHILISASHHEGLLLTALDDSTSLCRRAQSSANLGGKHPSTLRYMSQLGEIHIECGQYSRAEAILTEVQKLAATLWKTPRTETSMAQSQLALTQHYAGKLDIAKRTILAALSDQCSIYLPRNEYSPWLKSANVSIGNVFVIMGALGHDDSKSVTHPDILRSLLIYARIISSPIHPNPHATLRILQLVREAGNAQLGGSHPLSLMASLMMGEIFTTIAARAPDDTKLAGLYDKAISSFDCVMEMKDVPVPSVENSIKWSGSQDLEGSRSSFYITDSRSVTASGGGSQYYQVNRHARVRCLMAENPIVLSARQERILARLLSSAIGAEIGNVVDYRDELRDIWTTQRIRPGQAHRQTVKTLTTLLSLEMSFPEPSEEVSTFFNELVLPLRENDVEQERFLECLLLRERVADILKSRPDLLRDEYLGLLGDIKNQLEKVEQIGDPSVRVAVEEVKLRTKDMLGEL
ncbi:hypothetical protein FSHL1_010474 [Fusarium sambucinum]